jgi:hypothetical protein
VAHAVARVLEAEKEMLRERVAAQRFVLPRLPIIPLGVDCAAQGVSPEARDKARAEMAVAPDELVVLFVGRLSFHGKANPAPMYLALEAVAAGHRVVLVECGWTANDYIRNALAEARAALCPSVRSIVLDGRQAGPRRLAWCSADVFCSLSDNIQETFGLTPVEAMAAGIPCVVSDWDGYRDTVRHGIDGFAVPTTMAPPGSGEAFARAHATGADNYDTYIGRSALAVVVDPGAAGAALQRLAADADLRRRMGENAAARAREVFDWKVVIGAYEDLWDELDAERRSADATAAASARRWPSRLDPFTVFEKYASRTIGQTHTLRLRPVATTPAFEERLRLKIASYASDPSLKMETLTEVRDALLRGATTLAELISVLPPSMRTDAVRAVLLLAKFDLVEIVEPRNDARLV